MPALWDLSDYSSWLPSNDGKAGNDHGRRHYRAVENFDVVLDDGQLVDHAIATNVHVVANCGSLNDGPLANKDVVAEAERHVRKCSFVQPARGS